MPTTRSSFDGEEFRLSNPELYRMLDEAETGLAELRLFDQAVTPRPLHRRKSGSRNKRENLEIEKC